MMTERTVVVLMLLLFALRLTMSRVPDKNNSLPHGLLMP
jgi:hypothetical protein